MTDDQLLPLGLTEAEWTVLMAGLSQWRGPANCPAPVAVALGFDDAEDFHLSCRRFSEAMPGAAFTRRDWTRLLLVTEWAFIDQVFSVGFDWKLLTGAPDDWTLTNLRSIQNKLDQAQMIDYGLHDPAQP